MKITFLAVSVLALLPLAAQAQTPDASDFVVVVGFDAASNKFTYKEKKSGADATELHVKHMKSIEWQPEHPRTQTLTIDFTKNADSPFAAGQSRRGQGRVVIPRTLRKLRDQEQSARYKYGVTLVDKGGTHSEDPIIIIEQ